MPWASSSDVACRERGATHIDCAKLKRAGRVASALQQAAALAGWGAVFGIPIHNSAAEEALLEAASKTWLPIVAAGGGAELVLATDKDDARTNQRIEALVSSSGVRVHVHRCGVCCSGGMPTPGRKSQPAVASNAAASNASTCEGLQEGWMARSKVLHMLAFMHEMWGGNARGGARGTTGGASVATAAAAKHFFFKIDADTLMHPHHLLPLLRSLSFLAAAGEPMLLGLASCRSEKLPELCHAAGGAGYALTPASLQVIHSFVHGGGGGGGNGGGGVSSHRDAAEPALAEDIKSYGAPWLARLDRLTYGGEDVAVALALKESAAGVSVLNVGGFHQHPPARQPGSTSFPCALAATTANHCESLRITPLDLRSCPRVRVSCPQASYLFYRMDGISWPTVRPLSFHNLRSAGFMSALFYCTFYHRPPPRARLRGARSKSRDATPDELTPRCFTPSAEAYVRPGTSRPICASLIEDNETCIEPQLNVTLVNKYSDFGHDRHRATTRQPRQEHVRQRTLSSTFSSPRGRRVTV